MTEQAQLQASQSKIKKAVSIAVAVVAAIIAGLIAKTVVRGVMTPGPADRAAMINRGLMEGAAQQRRLLPQKLDDATTFTEIHVDGTTAEYRYLIGAGYELQNFAAFERGVRAKVCASSMKSAVESGASFVYTYSAAPPSNRQLLSFRISSCP
ncbi:MAG: hypothetical protein LCH88_16140 [Proteobacteria bacterium]|nr:hypothetical protein [Pseudomonadota bacterium]